MLTIDDKRVHFSRVYEEDGVHREYEEEEDSRQRLQFCYHVWIGDGAWNPMGICIWATGKYGVASEKEELLQDAVDELNRTITDKLEFLQNLDKVG